MAAEDALVLVQELAAGPSIGEALARYASRRRPRTAHVRETAAMRNWLVALPLEDRVGFVVPPLGRTGRRLLRGPAARAVTKTPRTAPSILTPVIGMLACVKDLVRLLRRIAVTVVGTVILVVGVVLLVAPGPGLLVIALALAVCAVEYEWARRRLAAVAARTPRAGPEPGPHPPGPG